MDFCILIGGPDGGKIIVRGVEPTLVGIRHEGEKRFLRPCSVDIGELLPWRWRRAFKRTSGCFWYDRDSRIDTERKLHGSPPHLALYDSRGRYMTTLYAVPA